MRCFLYIFSLFFIMEAQAAQINGKVIDAESGEPIEAVSVYINGSSLGTLSAADGTFELQGNFVFPVDVVFQVLSYETRMLRVSAAGALPKAVGLSVKAQELREVQVLAPLKDGWDLYGKDFLRSFISYSDFSNQCEILNKEVVQFKVDNTAGILYVTADAPIVVRNKALGYTLHFDLQDFRHDYRNKSVHFAGYTRFEPMKSKRKKQVEKWAANRKQSYLGSLNHFVRAAYNNKVEEEGFQLNVIVRAPAGEYGERVPIWMDTLNLKDTTDSKVFWKKFGATLDTQTVDNSKLPGMVFALKKWTDTVALNIATVLQAPMKDSLTQSEHKFLLEKIDPTHFQVKHFHVNRLPPSGVSPFDGRIFSSDTAMMQKMEADFWERAAAASFDYLYTTPYPIDSFLILENGRKKLFSENLIQVMYKLETEEQAYVKVSMRCGTPDKPCSAPGPQTSTLVFPQKDPVLLMPNGNFNEQYDLFLEGYWGYEKLDKMLPLDYEP